MPERKTRESEDLELMMFFLMMCQWWKRKKRAEGEQRTYVHRHRQSFHEITEWLSDSEFKQMFRVSRKGFSELVLLRPDISKFGADDAEQESKAHCSGKVLEAEFRIAIFLRMMAGGSYLDLMLVYQIGKSTVYSVFGSVLDAASKNLKWQTFPKSNDHEAFCMRALEFTESRRLSNPLPGCVGAVDGIHIKLEKPACRYNPRQWFSRKGYFSVPVQSMVDASYRFIASSAICKGATHDSIALDLSHIGKYLREGKLPKGFWIAGDDAYSVTDSLLIPFKRSLATKYQSGYNFFQSSHRIHVEQAFGMLLKRWGILWRPLKFNLRRATKIINVAMLLHNFCINTDGGVQKRQVPGAERERNKINLEKWLRWYRGNGDVEYDEFYAEEAVDDRDDAVASAKREKKSRAREWLLRLMKKFGMLRPGKRKAEDSTSVVYDEHTDRNNSQGEGSVDIFGEDFEEDFEGEEDPSEEPDDTNANDDDINADDVPIIQWRMSGRTVDELRIRQARIRL